MARFLANENVPGDAVTAARGAGIEVFLDLPPRDARVLKAEFGIREADCEPMFEALGRWRLLPDFPARTAGLLTTPETRAVLDLLGIRR